MNMFNNENGYSLADIAAATGSSANDGFFGGSGWWIILLFLFAWGGWGNGGYGNGGANGLAPAMIGNEINYGLGMNDLYHGITDLNSTVSNGFYNLNTGLLTSSANTNAAIAAGTSAIQSDLCNMGMQNLQNTNALNQAINANTVAGMQNTFGLTQQLSNMQSAQQLANCQTDQNIASSFATLNYNIATEACADRQAVADGARDIIENQNANTRSILDFLVQDRISALTNENSALKTQISQSEQNAYLLAHLQPTPSPAYIVANPYTGLYNYGYSGNGYYNGFGPGVPGFGPGPFNIAA